MLLNLSYGKQDFLTEVIESFANESGHSALFYALFGDASSKENSFLSTDSIKHVVVQAPECIELARYDTGKIFDLNA